MNLGLMGFVSALVLTWGNCGAAVAFEQTTKTAATTEVSAPATVAPVKSIRDIGENLGVQVRKAQVLRGDFGVDRDGNPTMYTVVMGAPAVFTALDVETGDVKTTRSLPGTSGAWAVHVSTDDTVYLGAYNKGLMFRYFPKTGELKNLGFPFPATKDAVIHPMDSAPDGKVYGGTYHSGHLYVYDPKAEKFTDLGQVTDIPTNERWLRVTVYDQKKNKLYIGVGNQPQLIEYDIATGERRDILPDEYSNITSVYDMNVVDGKIFVRKEANNQYEYFVLDQETGKQIEITNADTGKKGLTFLAHSRGVSPKSPVANKVYFTGPEFELFEYDLNTNTYRSLKHHLTGGSALGMAYFKLDDPDMPGYSLVGVAGHGGNIFKYNLETGKFKMLEVDLPAEPVLIHSIYQGPDGNIYTGGYLSGNVGVFNPRTGENRTLENISQSEGITSVGNKVYFGAYPGARIYEYDLAREWDHAATPPNPELIFNLNYNKDIPGYSDQDRPFAMVGAEDLQKLIVGTVPKNNMYGGALAIYDAANGGEPEVYWNIIPDQSITAVTYKDGLAYIGSSVQGGLGGAPKAKEAVLLLWDVEKGEKVFETIPVPGKDAITALHVGPDGNIWGWARGTLFIFDPATRKVVYSSDEFPAAHGRWLDGTLITGADNNVYGTINSRLVKINADTKAVTVLAKDAMKVVRDDAGRLYVYQHGTPILYRIDPREAAPGNL